jgi:centromere protein C
MAGDSSVQVSSSQEAPVRVGKGKRTGIIVGSQQDVPLKDGMEDVEAVFAAVQSPEPVASPGKENSADETVKKKAANAKKSIRFSLPGTAAATATASGDQDTVASSSSSTATPGKVPGIMKKFLSMGQRSSLSPSELSRVSTAPPSMDRSAVTQFEEEEGEEEEDEEDIEEVRRAQEKSLEEYANVAHRRSIGSPDAFPMDVDPGMDDDFPPADDDEDDGDALVPPAPPDSPEADDLETEEVEQMEKSATDVAFPAELDPDTDDDDKEGDGFNMPDDPDPETPASVREERRQDAEKLAEKKRKKKKGTKTRKLVDTSMEEEEEAPKSVPRKTKKQKKKFATNPFTPKGMPSGPREYEAVPVSDLKDSPKAGQEHLRRSKRARMTPLEYWRNEHIIYGPNDELDASDSLANMPVPKQISKALPTPYKMRKFTHRAAPAEIGGKSQKNASKDYPNLEDEPFDSTKLRRKQDYMEAEDGNMWDEAAEESTSQSTFFVICTLRCFYHFHVLALTLVTLAVLNRGRCLQRELDAQGLASSQE